MDEPTIIVCNPNGPLRVTGNFVIRDSQGKDFDLCRPKRRSLCAAAECLRTSHFATEVIATASIPLSKRGLCHHRRSDRH